MASSKETLLFKRALNKYAIECSSNNSTAKEFFSISFIHHIIKVFRLGLHKPKTIEEATTVLKQLMREDIDKPIKGIDRGDGKSNYFNVRNVNKIEYLENSKYSILNNLKKYPDGTNNRFLCGDTEKVRFKEKTELLDQLVQEGKVKLERVITIGKRVNWYSLYKLPEKGEHFEIESENEFKKRFLVTRLITHLKNRKEMRMTDFKQMLKVPARETYPILNNLIKEKKVEIEVRRWPTNHTRMYVYKWVG